MNGMKKTQKIVLTITAIGMLITLLGCGGTKYCKVDGCPAETSMHSDYCYAHKCVNSNCKNRRLDGYLFCEQCLERANKQ